MERVPALTHLTSRVRVAALTLAFPARDVGDAFAVCPHAGVPAPAVPSAVPSALATHAALAANPLAITVVAAAPATITIISTLAPSSAAITPSAVPATFDVRLATLAACTLPAAAAGRLVYALRLGERADAKRDARLLQ